MTKFFYVLEHGRPVGLQPDIFEWTEAEAAAEDKLINEHNPIGTGVIKFNTYDEAYKYIHGHVPTKTSNQGGISQRSIQAGPKQVSSLPEDPFNA